MNESFTLLASAYLDGDVTAAERAHVERDPALLAEVERLRAVRLLVGNVETPKISVREAHLAAAFDVWDRLPDAERTGRIRDATPTGSLGADAAGAASVRAPSTLRDRRRSTPTRWLTGAAAALVVVLAGGLALQFAATDTDDSADVGTSEAGDSAGAAAAEQADTSADDVGVAELDAATAPDATVRLDTDVDAPPPPREEELLQQLLTADDLADFAAPAFGAPSAPDVPAATSAPVDDALDEQAGVADLPVCLSVDIVVGTALFGEVLVVVGIDEGRDLALAYEPESCNEVARAQLADP